MGMGGWKVWGWHAQLPAILEIVLFDKLMAIVPEEQLFWPEVMPTSFWGELAYLGWSRIKIEKASAFSRFVRVPA